MPTWKTVTNATAIGYPNSLYRILGDIIERFNGPGHGSRNKSYPVGSVFQRKQANKP